MHQDIRGDFQSAQFEAEAALERNPSFSQALGMQGVALCHLDDREHGLDALDRAIRATPEDPHRFRHLRELALAEWMFGRSDEAARRADRLIRQAPDILRNHLVAVALLREAGRIEDAERSVEVLLQAEPRFSLETMRPTAFHDPAWRERFARALADSGIPSG